MRPIAILLTLACTAPLTRAADTDSVDTVVRAVYDVISGPAGPRDWARFKALFAEGARLIPIRITGEASSASVMAPEDYAQRAGANFTKNAFYESETARRVWR